MAKYMIHAMPKRMWYVNDFLIPSMLKQGIDKSNIIVYNDIDGDKNLVACMKAFSQVEGDGGTWHIQDDVLISSKFKEITEKFDHGVVCGFHSTYDERLEPGDVDLDHMWFSFPCIRIPNDYARACSEWIMKYILHNPIYELWCKDGVNDDWSFRLYMQTFQKDCRAINLSPNIVEHVDMLIGGSVNALRKPTGTGLWIRSIDWHENELVEELEKQLNAL